MRELGGRFPNLERLDLYSLNWGPRGGFIPPRMFRFFSTFASVRTLSLRTVQFPSFGTMRDTITALPSLTNLGIYGVMWPVSRGIRPPRSTQKSKDLKNVRMLHIQGLDSPLEEEMFEWPSGTSLGTSLVDILMESTMLIKGFEIWEHAGPSVTQLGIKFLEERRELRDNSTSHQYAMLSRSY